MAKAFYTQEEAQEALSTDEEGLKALVRDNKLTEYRDGDQLMYKGSQVESLTGGDAIGLGDSGAPIGLADSGGGSAMGSDLGLADSGLDLGGSSDNVTVPPAEQSAGELSVEDTGAFALSDSDTGGESGYDLGGASASGITIFETDDDIDPNAQTGLGDDGSGSEDQVNLEGIGSGSGLLDLTQEADDTSFGAETFDEIMPSESGMGTAMGSVAGYTGSGMEIDTAVAPAGTRQIGVAYEPYDPSASIFGGLAAGATASVILGILGVATATLGGSPGFLSFFLTEGEGVNLATTAGVLAGLPILGAVIGFIASKAGN